MNPRDAKPGRLVSILDPGRLLYRLTRGGKLPLTGYAGHPFLAAALREHGTILQVLHGRAWVAFPSAPAGLWLDLAEITPADPAPTRH